MRPTLVHLGNSIFLVIYGLPDDGLTLREVHAYDKDGEYIVPGHGYMSSAFPGWDASHCHDLDSDTFCTTRLGDQDPWLELEYPMDHGFARIEIENYNKGNEGCRIVVYRDHFWHEMLWESFLEGQKDVYTFDGKFIYWVIVPTLARSAKKLTFGGGGGGGGAGDDGDNSRAFGHD